MNRTQFTRLQEAVFHLERAHTPWNIQVEAETTARLDAERLRKAARRACETYPIAKARVRRDGRAVTSYAWVVPDGSAAVPVEVADADADLEALRRRFYGRRFDLESEPPLRLLVIRDGADSGDRLCVCTSHVPMDGIGAYRLLQALLVAYRGDRPTPDPIAGTPQDVLSRIRPASRGMRLRLLAGTARRLRYLLDPPVELSGETLSFERQPTLGDWRFAHRHLDSAATEQLIAASSETATVNDLLLTALQLAIDRWNANRGAEGGNISVMMPVNVRPEAAFYDGVGMYTLFDSVATDPADRRNSATVLDRVTEQTRRIKQDDRPLGYLEWWRLVSSVAPHSVRKRLPLLLEGPGERLLDTAILSNLGAIPRLPGLPEGSIQRSWLTPPCWPPTPLSIGVVTVGDQLHLGFRYQRDAFDAAAAESFADRFRERIDAVVNAINAINDA